MNDNDDKYRINIYNNRDLQGESFCRIGRLGSFCLSGIRSSERIPLNVCLDGVKVFTGTDMKKSRKEFFARIIRELYKRSRWSLKYREFAGINLSAI